MQTDWDPFFGKIAQFFSKSAVNVLKAGFPTLLKSLSLVFTRNYLK